MFYNACDTVLAASFVIGFIYRAALAASRSRTVCIKSNSTLFSFVVALLTSCQAILKPSSTEYVKVLSSCDLGFHEGKWYQMPSRHSIHPRRATSRFVSVSNGPQSARPSSTAIPLKTVQEQSLGPSRLPRRQRQYNSTRGILLSIPIVRKNNSHDERKTKLS